MNAIIPLVSLEPAPTSLRSSDGLSWDDFAATLLGIRAGAYRVPAMTQHRVNVHVGPPMRMNCVCDGRRYPRIQAYGNANAIPVDVSGVRTDDTDCRVLWTTISDRFVRSIAE